MKTILKSKLFLLALFVVLYGCLFMGICYKSTSFGYYARKIFDIWYENSFYPFYFFLGAVVFAFFIILAWHQSETEFEKCICRLKWWVVSAVLLIICLICIFVIFQQYNLFLTIIILPFAAYSMVMLWFYCMVVYIKSGVILKKAGWRCFFEYFPIGQPIGGLITFLLYINVLLLFSELITSFKNGIVYPLISVLSIIVISFIASLLSKFSENHAKAYEKATEEKIKSERLKTELIANVSHDIKTPLTSIINYVDLLSKIKTDEENIIEYTAVLQKKSGRLKRLIEDLIEASKAGTGNVTVLKEMINWNELIGQIAGEFDEQMNENHLELIMKIPSETVSISADRNHLWRVMENIFNNAVKYSMSGTRIYASLDHRVNNAVFSLKNVSKEPLNISPDELTEQFIREDRSRLTEGSGLGLNIAKSLTEAMGGIFTVNITGDLFEVHVKFN